MLPSFPLAAAFLDQYALLTAAALTKQQQQANPQQQETTQLALEALWPSLLYGRLLAANSTTTSLTPPSPQKARKYRGFSVKDLLDVEEEPAESSIVIPPLSPSSSPSKTAKTSSAEVSPVVTTSSTSSNSLIATLANPQGPLEELCKLASRPIVEESNNQPAHATPHFLVSQMMLPNSPISRAIGEFGSCPNLDQASSSNFAALLHQQRIRQVAAAAAATVAGASSGQSNTDAAVNEHRNHHHRFYHQSKPATSASLSNVALHSLSLVRRKRKTRTSFTPHQIAELEKRFFKQKYLTSSDRDDLASSLNLTAGQVITWFQNRRAKLKRDIEEIKSDIKMEGSNNNNCGSLSSASPPSPDDGSFVEEEESSLVDENPGTITDFSKALHAVSEPSIHKLVTSIQFATTSKK